MFSPFTSLFLSFFCFYVLAAEDLCSDETFSFLMTHVIPKVDDAPAESKGSILIYGETEFSLQNLVSGDKYNQVEFRKFKTSSSQISSLPESLPQSSVTICSGAAQFLGKDPAEGHALSSQLVGLLTASRPRVIIFSSSGPLDFLTLLSAQQSAQQNLSAVGSPHLMGFLEQMIDPSGSAWRNEMPNSFWIELFDSYGYQYSVVSTATARNMAFSILNHQEQEECKKNECFVLSRLASFGRNGLIFYPKSNYGRLIKEQISLARDPTSLNGLGWFNFHCVISIDWLTAESNLFRILTGLLERDRLEYLSLFSQYKVQWFTKYLNQLLRTSNYTTFLSENNQSFLTPSNVPLAGTFCSLTPAASDCSAQNSKDSSTPDKWKQIVVSKDEQVFLSQDSALEIMKLYIEGKHNDLLMVLLTQLILIQKYQLYSDAAWLQKESRWVIEPLLYLLARPDLHLPSTQLTLELVSKNALIHEFERVLPELNLDRYIQLVLANSDQHQDKVSEGFKLQILISEKSNAERKEHLRKNLDSYRILDVWSKSSL